MPWPYFTANYNVLQTNLPKLRHGHPPRRSSRAILIQWPSWYLHFRYAYGT